MTPERIARLTPQQRACLRLVFEHRSSKEIAPVLGIEPGSVDQHVKAAMRTLGVHSRRTAACLLAEHERKAYQKLVLQSPDVAGTAPPRPFDREAEHDRGAAEGPTILREEQRPYLVPATERLRQTGGRPDDLGWAERLKWIAAIAIATALGFGVLLSAVAALAGLAGD